MQGGNVSLKLAPGVSASLNGKPVDSDALLALKSDADGGPDKLMIRDLTLTVIKRGKRVGIRVYNPNSEVRRRFGGERWFPINRAYVIHARFVPYKTPRKMPIVNVLGDVRMALSPGYVVFPLHGRLCRLETEAEDDGLFLNFQDRTTGQTTYHAGRFLDTPKPINGFVEIDFNKATNPPCAYTSFATCPLPPKDNRLPVAILAGEKSYLQTRVH
jgi:uncharacterized protein (DUF1684 family)